MSSMREVVKSPSFTRPLGSKKMLSGLRFRCMTPWWCTCERPRSSCRNLPRTSLSRSQPGRASSLLFQAAKLSCTNSVQTTARRPRISAPRCLTTFGCCSRESSAASRRKDVGTPSSLPAFVSARSTTLSSTTSRVPKRQQRNSRPFDRRSTTFSTINSWSTRRRCIRRSAQSSWLCATSRQSRQAGAALPTRSRTPSRPKTSSSALPRWRSRRPGEPPKPSPRAAGFTGSTEAGSSACVCFRFLVGDRIAALRLMRCNGLLWEIGVCLPVFGFGFSFSWQHGSDIAWSGSGAAAAAA
mmetsp:Transcript_97696/g.276389  ORF Transcript_97696/g.276389 Transcript_97696/m.276389 type:complete len:298 (+) Transcript_97696:599-1492(+)